MTVGGNLSDCAGDLTNPTVTSNNKFLLNSIVSTLNDIYLTAKIKSFYLNNNLPDQEYMKLHISEIFRDIIAAYNLLTLQDNNGWVYMRIYKVM